MWAPASAGEADGGDEEGAGEEVAGDAVLRGKVRSLSASARDPQSHISDTMAVKGRWYSGSLLPVAQRAPPHRKLVRPV